MISNGGLVVPAVPKTPEHIQRAITWRRSWLRREERALLEYDENNWAGWVQRFVRECVDTLTLYDGGYPHMRYNAAARHDWWRATGQRH